MTAAHLSQRLAAVLPIVLPEHPSDDRHPGDLLDLLVREVQRQSREDLLWLLLVAVNGVFPTTDDLLEARRHFELSSAAEATFWLLDNGICSGIRGLSFNRNLRIVDSGVLVDVDHTARNDLHTGIQRVVRQLMPIWIAERDVEPVAWTPGQEAHRVLSPREFDRVSRWADTAHVPSEPDADLTGEIVVAWHGVVVLAEVPDVQSCSRLEALARFSGTTVVAIGYDCIPVVSADLVPLIEPSRFTRYLAVVKHCRRVAGISSSATIEFGGFADALPAQGLTPPIVTECLLPADAAEPGAPAAAADARPLVLAVGNLEPRKNHLAILYAAEVLWREGLDFRVEFVSGSAWFEPVLEAVAELADRGRPIVRRTGITDAELTEEYRTARFTVFPSLHEGYGLPVAESLAAGTPAVTTDYGSTAEIAVGGGVVLIDPRDDDALVAAMRRLLTDDALLDELVSEIHRRPSRSWRDYAGELWNELVAR